MMKKIICFLIFCFIANILSAQFSVSANHRYLLKDGKPFFWMGDTGWELFQRLNREDAVQYLQHRAEQGFTVIQAVVLAELDGLHTPNAYGDTPLINDDPAKPNEAYFKQVDYIIDKADSFHLNIALLPTWGDKFLKINGAQGRKFLMPEMPSIMEGGLAIVTKTKQILSGYSVVTAIPAMTAM